MACITTSTQTILKTSIMKKLLLILLFLPMIFSSCQENHPGPPVAPPSSSSSVCGTATLTVGGTNYTLNNPLMHADGTCSKMSTISAASSGTGLIFTVNFQNMYPNNWEHEWVLNLQFLEVIGSNMNPFLYGSSLTLGSNTNNPTTVSYQSYVSHSQSSLVDSSITIYIDSTNNTIDGNFSCIVYHAYAAKDSTNLINFTNIPSTIFDHSIVYVDDHGNNPSAIVGYHDNINNTWYNAYGLVISDLNPLAEAAGGKLAPYVTTNSTPQMINVSFSDIPFLP